MNRLVTLAVLATAGSAVAQPLPAPQFATPPTTDSSSRAATTSWVHSQGYLSGAGDSSATTILAPGSLVPRTAAARAATVFNVLDYGAVADGFTDIGPALNAIAAKLGASAVSNVIYFPAGSYRLASPVTFAGVAPILQGQGFAQGPSPTNAAGTWIKIDQTGFVPITFSGTNARGAQVRDLASWQVHPAPSPGWSPTSYDYVFKILNALGEVAFDNVLFAGVNRGIYADNSGRLNIRNVQGQFYTAGIEIDDCYDIPRIERLHAWTFASAAPSVVSYQEANEDTVILRRVDGIFIGDLFSLGAHSAVHLTSGVNGVTTKFYIGNLYADFVTYALWIDGAGTNGQIANLTSQNNDQTNPGTMLLGGRAISVLAPNVGLQISNFRANSVAGPAIDLESSNARLDIDSFWANTFGAPGAGTPAIFAADSATNPTNVVVVRGLPYLQGVAPLYLFNPSSNAGRARSLVMNMAGNDSNEVRAYGAAAGSPTSLAAIGGDASIDLQLQAKSNSGSVKLQSNGQTVLRIDNANSGLDDILVRSGGGSLSLISEGNDPSIDEYLTPKGVAGGVRLQPNGLVTLRTDNPNGGDSTLLVRPGVGATNLIVESGSTAADLLLAGKGATGGVRLQANGSTTLRSDNPSAVTDDLLVRPGPGALALTAEGSDPNINLVLSPKAAGSVALNEPLLPPADNSTNAATTAWVKSLGYGGSSAGVTTFNTRAGAVTLSSADVTAALGFVPYSAGNPSNFISAAGAPVQSVAGRTGSVTLAVSDVAGAAPSASPVLTGTATVAAFNSLTLSGAPSGSGPTIAVAGGDAGVDLNMSALGTGNSVRLKANGITVLRADSPAPGDSNLLVRSGLGVMALTVESGSSSANLALNPKGTGVVSAPTPPPTDNSTTVATTAFVRAAGYAASASPTLSGTTTIGGAANSLSLSGSVAGFAPTIAATGNDTNVNLSLAAKGSGGIVLVPGSATAKLTVSAGGLNVQAAGSATTNLGSSGTGGSATVVTGAEANQGVVVLTSGSAATLASNLSRVILAGGTASPFTLTMPASPVDGQLVLIECDQGMTLTVAPGTGQTMRGAPTACSAAQGHQFHYRSADTSWRTDF